MSQRRDRVLAEIEKGALDGSVPVTDVLRKVLVLGGHTGSTELRDWASQELQGYGPTADLPGYRTIQAPLQHSGSNLARRWSGALISPMELPDFARQHITNDVPMVKGIGEIASMIDQARTQGGFIRLQPPGAQELVVILNQHQDYGTSIDAIYWSVSEIFAARPGRPR